MSRLNVNQIYTRTGTGSPAIREMPIVYVQRSATQSFSNGTTTLIEYDTVDTDIGNYFNTGTYRYLPLIAGWYFFTLKARVSVTSPVTGWIALYKNGIRDNLDFVDRSGAAVLYLSYSTLIYLNGSTDYVEGYVNVSGTSPILLTTNELTTDFRGFLVRPD